LLLFATDATIEHARTRVETHYHHGRDAGNFGRWQGARSDVIYTIMGDEQRHQRLKRAAFLRVAAKIATGFVERLDRIPDTLFAFLVPGPRFCP
jgi:hypothetical protein